MRTETVLTDLPYLERTDCAAQTRLKQYPSFSDKRILRIARRTAEQVQCICGGREVTFTIALRPHRPGAGIGSWYNTMHIVREHPHLLLMDYLDSGRRWMWNKRGHDLTGQPPAVAHPRAYRRFRHIPGAVLAHYRSRDS